MKKNFSVALLSLVVLSALGFYSIDNENLASKKLGEIVAICDTFNVLYPQEHPLGVYDSLLFKKDAAFAQDQIKNLLKIDKEKLNENDKITLELLRFTLQERVDFYTYKMYLNPIQADQGFHLDLNYQVAPITSLQHAKHYLAVLNDIPHFVDQQLILIREGLILGLSQPRIILDGYEKTYNAHLLANPEDDYFFSPFLHLPNTFSSTQKDSLKMAAKSAISNQVVPAFQRIKQFFEEEYYPKTRTSIGVSATPNGANYYQNRINFYTTTTQYSANDIFEIGQQEVARIRILMLEIARQQGFDDDLQGFINFLRTDQQFYVSDGEELLKAARNITKQIDAQLPYFFITLPRRPYGVKKVPDAIAPKYTTGRYSGPSKTSHEPGWFLVNTYKTETRPLYNLPALAAHESVPGHHLQGSLTQELGDSVPNFRTNLYLSAYGEGWALYCEQLAGEMGIYQTPYEKFGQLTYEMWRACRLVVDVGLHTKGWTRQQAIDFMAQNTALPLLEINTEVDRYIGWPGQALSYKIGELKIKELRAKAEKALGSQFDIREFHEVILNQGTVTLPILERRINAYIEQTLSRK